MVTDFKVTMQNTAPKFLCFDKLQTLQVNLGNLCNQQCQHCHIEASPSGNKIMSRSVYGASCTFSANFPGITVDITGGCPETEPEF